MGLSARFQLHSVLVFLMVFQECFDFHGWKPRICLLCFTSGCPPCMRRCNRHGDGALHPGRSRLRHQPLLLRLHPECNQVQLPQEVCTCPPLSGVTSHRFFFLNVVSDLGFLVRPLARPSIGASLLLHSLIMMFIGFLFWGFSHWLSHIITWQYAAAVSQQGPPITFSICAVFSKQRTVGFTM